MNWVRLETSLPDDPRVFVLAETLGRSHDSAVGIVALLLAYAGRQETGDFGPISAKHLAAAARLPGSPTRTVAALQESGFLSRGPDGHLSLVGFDAAHRGMLTEREAVRERVARHREAARTKESESPVTPLQPPLQPPLVTGYGTVTPTYLPTDLPASGPRPTGGGPLARRKTRNPPGTNARTAAAAAPPCGGSAASSARAVPEQEPKPPAARRTATGETAPEPRPAPLPLPVASPLPEPTPIPAPASDDDDDGTEPVFLAVYRDRAAAAAAAGDHATARRWTDRADRYQRRAAEAFTGAEA